MGVCIAQQLQAHNRKRLHQDLSGFMAWQTKLCSTKTLFLSILFDLFRYMDRCSSAKLRSTAEKLEQHDRQIHKVTCSCKYTLAQQKNSMRASKRWQGSGTKVLTKLDYPHCSVLTIQSPSNASVTTRNCLRVSLHLRQRLVLSWQAHFLFKHSTRIHAEAPTQATTDRHQTWPTWQGTNSHTDQQAEPTKHEGKNLSMGHTNKQDEPTTARETRRGTRTTYTGKPKRQTRGI